VLGKEVATLVNEYKPAGNYEVEFYAVGTSRDLSLPSGVYLYQLRIGDPGSSSQQGQVGQGIIQTKKMVFIK